MAPSFVRIDGFMSRQGRICHASLLDFPHQAKLIFLNLNKQMAFRLTGRPDCFFDNAWRPE